MGEKRETTRGNWHLSNHPSHSTVRRDFGAWFPTQKVFQILQLTQMDSHPKEKSNGHVICMFFPENLNSHTDCFVLGVQPKQLSFTKPTNQPTNQATKQPTVRTQPLKLEDCWPPWFLKTFPGSAGTVSLCFNEVTQLTQRCWVTSSQLQRPWRPESPGYF